MMGATPSGTCYHIAYMGRTIYEHGMLQWESERQGCDTTILVDAETLSLACAPAQLRTPAVKLPHTQTFGALQSTVKFNRSRSFELSQYCSTSPVAFKPSISPKRSTPTSSRPHLHSRTAPRRDHPVIMNNYSFLDSTSNVAMPRSAPSPQPSQTSQMNGGPQQNGVPMVNGLPSGGQQTDMNHLWTVVQQLSQLLEDNKAQTQGVLSGVQALQQRAAEEGSLGSAPGHVSAREVNGEISGTLTPTPIAFHPSTSSYPYIEHSRLTPRRSSLPRRRALNPTLPPLHR